MHFELLFPSKYLKASDLRGMDVNLTICPKRGVAVEMIKAKDGQEEARGVIYFVETGAKATKEKTEEKRLVLNKTNAQTIAKIHGSEMDDWGDCRITIFSTTCLAFGETKDCIRVRAKAPKDKE